MYEETLREDVENYPNCHDNFQEFSKGLNVVRAVVDFEHIWKIYNQIQFYEMIVISSKINLILSNSEFGGFY